MEFKQTLRLNHSNVPTPTQILRWQLLRLSAIELRQTIYAEKRKHPNLYALYEPEESPQTFSFNQVHHNSARRIHRRTSDEVIAEIMVTNEVHYNNNALPEISFASPSRKLTEQERQRAQDFVSAVAHRARFITTVAQWIFYKQERFFQDPDQPLVPARLIDATQELGCSESTLSSVTNRKYMQTPHGVYAFQYFFNSAIPTEDNQDIASVTVRQKIKAIVENENPAFPLNDEAIADELQKTEQIVIARRTVAKYRQLLNIPSAGQRRQT